MWSGGQVWLGGAENLHAKLFTGSFQRLNDNNAVAAHHLRMDSRVPRHE